MSKVEDFINGQFLSKKMKEVGIGGFTALVRTRERYVRTSSVPTTFLEDGRHINDHIIRDPLTILIEGNVSDIHIRPPQFIEAVKRIQGYIGIITQYTPERTAAQVNKVEALTNDFATAINRIDAAIDAGQQLSGFIGLIDAAEHNNIDRFIATMEAIYYGDHLIEIDTISGTHEKMRITHLEVERDNEQNAVSFRIEAQQLRFAESIFTRAELARRKSEGLDGQDDSVEDKGVQEGGEVEQSTLDYYLEKFGW